MRRNLLRSERNNLRIDSAWSGYSTPYIQNIIKTVLKSLKLLSGFTFDPKLYFWSKGLENHLEKKMKEADKEKKEDAKKYRF